LKWLAAKHVYIGSKIAMVQALGWSIKHRVTNGIKESNEDVQHLKVGFNAFQCRKCFVLNAENKIGTDPSFRFREKCKSDAFNSEKMTSQSRKPGNSNNQLN